MHYKTPVEVDCECVDRDWHTGETQRIKHQFSDDGTECSVNKSAALSITRKADGWWWNCFRCGEHGFKKDTHIEVAQVEKELSALRMIRRYKTVEKVSLPHDRTFIVEKPGLTKGVPRYVYKWLWDNNTYGDTYEKYNLYWSPSYQRVIIPIYEYDSYTALMSSRKLVGWVGRDARDLTKVQRAKIGVPKYITRKQKDYNRIYFHAPADSKVYVIVEDALSAMKVCDACNVNAIALLTTNMPTSMLLRMHGKKVILWLDQDQLFNMIMTVVKGNNVGIDTAHIHTNRDPKCYNSFAIKSQIDMVKGDSV